MRRGLKLRTMRNASFTVDFSKWRAMADEDGALLLRVAL
jgi:hypothetical protein